MNTPFLVLKAISVVPKRLPNLLESIAIFVCNANVCISSKSDVGSRLFQREMTLFFSYQVANMIRFLVDSYNKPVPAILEIPSKDHPYDPAHDSVLSRVKYLFNTESVASGRR